MKKMLLLDIGKKFPIVHVVIGENNKKKVSINFFLNFLFYQMQLLLFIFQTDLLVDHV